jgi:hypothetical protein
MSRDSSVGAVTKLRAGPKYFSLLQSAQMFPWDPNILIFIVYRGGGLFIRG